MSGVDLKKDLTVAYGYLNSVLKGILGAFCVLISGFTMCCEYQADFYFSDSVSESEYMAFVDELASCKFVSFPTRSSGRKTSLGSTISYWLEKHDRNGDMSLSESEAPGLDFLRWDKDQDQRLDFNELRHVEAFSVYRRFLLEEDHIDRYFENLTGLSWKLRGELEELGDITSSHLGKESYFLALRNAAVLDHLKSVLSDEEYDGFDDSLGVILNSSYQYYQGPRDRSRARIRSRFSSFDENGDGVIAGKERSKLVDYFDHVVDSSLPSDNAEFMNSIYSFDMNDDGDVAYPEISMMNGKYDALFETLDSNRDLVISRQELELLEKSTYYLLQSGLYQRCSGGMGCIEKALERTHIPDGRMSGVLKEIERIKQEYLNAVNQSRSSFLDDLNLYFSPEAMDRISEVYADSYYYN